MEAIAIEALPVSCTYANRLISPAVSLSPSTAIMSDSQYQYKMAASQFERAKKIRSEDITSCYRNAVIVQRIRWNDPTLTDLSVTAFDSSIGTNFLVDDDGDDDLEWLGYFIGENTKLRELFLSVDVPGERVRELLKGVNRNRSIEYFVLNEYPEFRVALLSSFLTNNHNLKHIDLDDANIENDDVAELAKALGNQPQLKYLYLGQNHIGRSGCVTLISQLVCAKSWSAPHLYRLDLDNNEIDDAGVQILATGLAHCTHLKALDLSENRLISLAGFRSLAALFRSASCGLEELFLRRISIGDDGAEVLADGLVGNTSLMHLIFSSDEAGITALGWSAFSKLLCDTTTIDNTYLSNHTLELIGDYEDGPDEVTHNLKLHASESLSRKGTALTKIAKHHPDLNINNVFISDLKLLPLLTEWFQRSREEGCEELLFVRMQLSAYYNTVRRMPLLVSDGFWSTNTNKDKAEKMNTLARKRKFDEWEK